MTQGLGFLVHDFPERRLTRVLQIPRPWDNAASILRWENMTAWQDVCDGLGGLHNGPGTGLKADVVIRGLAPGLTECESPHSKRPVSSHRPKAAIR